MPKKENSTVEIPVKVMYDSGFLTLRVPPTFARSGSSSWALAYSVKSALESYVKKNGKPEIPHPAFVIVKRKVAAFKGGYRDNENFETSRIINAVMEVLGYTDRADHLGYISILDIVSSPSKSCVEFTFCAVQTVLNEPSIVMFGIHQHS